MRALVAGSLLVLAAAPAQAQTGADQLREFLYEGRIAEGIETLAAQDDPEAAFGVGFLTFVSGVEGLASAFYRHGFDPQRGIGEVPIFGMPTSDERQREPDSLNYDAFCGYLESFVETMDEAHGLLLSASEDRNFAVEIDIMRVRIDIDGDGVAGETESIGAFLAQAAGMATEFGVGDEMEQLPATFAFDAADAIWMAGYSQILAFNADFLLAHDFGTLFDAVMHRLFPGSGLPMEAYVPADSLFFDRESDTLLADTITAIHLINWPVIDSARFVRAQERALAVIGLSRRNWEAILSETDDNLEFIPSPYQTPVHESMEINKAMVTAWHEALESTEKILKGELFLPHWRFSGAGFDLNAYFNGAERTDLVLLLAGFDALPFLRDGKIASEEDFAATNEVFGDAIWGYALWFN